MGGRTHNPLCRPLRTPHHSTGLCIQTHCPPAIINHIKILPITRRRGHIRRSSPLPLPHHIVGNIARATSSQRQQGPLPGRRINHIADHHRRRHNPIIAPPTGIQPICPPDLMPRIRIVPRHTIPTRNNNLSLAIALQKRGRRVRIRRLPNSICRPLLAPGLLPIPGIQCHNIRRIIRTHPVKHLKNELAIVQNRRRRIPEKQTKVAVILLEIARPDRFPRHIQTRHNPIARNHPHMRPIRNRRRRRRIVLAPQHIALIQLIPPEFTPVFFRQTQNINLRSPRLLFLWPLCRRRRRQKNAITPDNGRTPAPRRQLGLPDNILFKTPGRGQIFGRTHPILLRTAPLRPVICLNT